MPRALYCVPPGAMRKITRKLCSVVVVSLLFLCSCGKPPSGKLLAAFPKGPTEIRLVFSDTVDRRSAELPESYRAASGLKILRASVDAADPRRVTLKTAPMATWMSGPPTGRFETPADLPLIVDVISASGVRTIAGAALASPESPRFIQGTPSVYQIQKPRDENYPFTSRYVGLTVAHAYNPDGGTGGNVLIDALGFMFLHRPTGGPFNSIKIVTTKHVPGLEEAKARLKDGQGLHVLWAGGQIQTVDGETRLVDTGFMEGSVIEPPLNSPPPYPIKTLEISRDSGRTLRAKSLQGVIVQLDDVTIDGVSPPNERQLRSVVLHDRSGARVHGLLLHTVTQTIHARQRFQTIRGIVHQPHAGEYEVIIEMDQHLRGPSSKQ